MNRGLFIWLRVSVPDQRVLGGNKRAVVDSSPVIRRRDRDAVDGGDHEDGLAEQVHQLVVGHSAGAAREPIEKRTEVLNVFGAESKSAETDGGAPCHGGVGAGERSRLAVGGFSVGHTRSA